MRQRSLLIAAVVFLAATFTVGAHAQDQQAPPPAQPSQQSAAPPPAPAPSDAQDSKDSSAAKPQPPAKKVWTNENVGDLDPHAGVSTVGNGKVSKLSPNSSGPKNAQYYKNKITELKNQLPPLEKKIAEIEDTLNGKPTGDAKESTRSVGVSWDTWQHELTELKKKRDDILAQIAALEDEARHNGVDPNALP